MSKCTCIYGNSRNSREVRLGIALSGFVKEKCAFCLLEEQAEEALAQRIQNREDAARERFMAMPEHPDRWDAVFDFMYKQGYRP